MASRASRFLELCTSVGVVLASSPARPAPTDIRSDGEKYGWQSYFQNIRKLNF